MNTKLKLALATMIPILSFPCSGASFFIDDLHELTVESNINLNYKYSELDNDKCYGELQFEAFDFGIKSKYYNQPYSFIHTKVILDLRSEVNSNIFSDCLNEESQASNANNVIEPDIVEELSLGYAIGIFSASIGKIPAYAETIDITESYDSESFAAFDDEVLTESQQSNDIILRGEWKLEKFNLILDLNPATDTDEAKENVLNGGLTVETLFFDSWIFSAGYKNSYSVLFEKDISTFGISIEDILYDRRENPNKALDISLAKNDLGDYLNISFSYYIEDYGKISVGADRFDATKSEFEEIGREGSDRSLHYLNYTHALYKYYKIFAELNQYGFEDNDVTSVLVGIGSNF